MVGNNKQLRSSHSVLLDENLQAEHFQLFGKVQHQVR